MGFYFGDDGRGHSGFDERVHVELSLMKPTFRTGQNKRSCESIFKEEGGSKYD